jgi:hypothetical protein
MEKPDLYVVARFLDIMFSNGSSMKKTNIRRLDKGNFGWSKDMSLTNFSFYDRTLFRWSI